MPLADRRAPELLALGFALIGFGIVGTLATLGLVDAVKALHVLWPVAFIVWGALELLAWGAARRRV